MRILMFGWEFPPYISGGLGTACFGITKGLTEQGNEVIFVLPTVKDKGGDVHVKLLSVSEVPFSGLDIVNNFMNDEWKNNLEIRALNSTLRPYMNDEQYHTFLTNIYGKETSDAPIYLKLSGDYGPNLFAEVVRYGRAARSIAEEENFDIIHGHDWTSVFACVSAKMISGRPYIYHAHALEFDRSGENINRIVYDIEKYGMEMADHVIAVSYYTKNNIINRYGIAPEHVVAEGRGQRLAVLAPPHAITVGHRNFVPNGERRLDRHGHARARGARPDAAVVVWLATIARGGPPWPAASHRLVHSHGSTRLPATAVRISRPRARRRFTMPIADSTLGGDAVQFNRVYPH